MNYLDHDFIGTEILRLNARRRSQVLLNVYEIMTSFSERKITITVQVFPHWQKMFMIICGKGGFGDCWYAAAQVDILPSSPKKLWLCHHDDLDML